MESHLYGKNGFIYKGTEEDVLYGDSVVPSPRIDPRTTARIPSLRMIAVHRMEKDQRGGGGTKDFISSNLDKRYN